MASQAVGLNTALLGRPLDDRSPGRHDSDGQGRQGQQHERHVDRHQQRDDDGQAQEPAAGREDGDIHVIEDKDLVAQHGQAVQIIRPLLVSDSDERCLQLGNVSFERDGNLVTKTPLHPGAHHAEEPGRGG